MLQPIDPGGNARESTLAAYRAGKSKWERDPLQYACKAYCTARQGSGERARALFSAAVRYFTTKFQVREALVNEIYTG